jgi:hypothetical protein
VENRVCLSHGVHVAGAAWRAGTRIVEGVDDLVQRTGYGRTCQVLGGRTIGRSGDTVCGLYHAHGDEEREFLGLASKSRSTFWPQNHWDDFSQFDLKIGGDSFSRFGLRTGSRGFPSLGLKIGSYDLVICVSKSL